MKLRQIPVEFDEPTHTYRLHGQLLTGVSSVLDVKAKPGLVPWAAKEAVLSIDAAWNCREVYSPESKAKILDDGRRAHTRKADRAKDKGHAAHAWIKDYLRGLKPRLPTDDAVLAAVEEFLSWERQHDVRWKFSELIVCSESHQLAGTLDFIAIVDGLWTLGDFKTSAKIRSEYYLQCAAYQLMLEEMLEEGHIDQRMVIRIPKDGADFEARRVPTDIDFDKRTFLHLREVHRWNVYLKSLGKKEAVHA